MRAIPLLEETAVSPLDSSRSQSTPTRYGRKLEIPESELRSYRPTPGHGPKRGGGKTVLVLLLLIVVVVATILAYTYFPSSAGNTPEEVFLSIVEAAKDGDDERMIQLSVAYFAEGAMRETACTELECQLWMFIAWTTVLNSYELMEGDESPYIQNELDIISDYNERTYSIDITDCCVVIANCTVYAGGNAVTGESAFPFVKIGSDWYLALVPIPEGEVITEPPELPDY